MAKMDASEAKELIAEYRKCAVQYEDSLRYCEKYNDWREFGAVEQAQEQAYDRLLAAIVEEKPKKITPEQIAAGQELCRMLNIKPDELSEKRYNEIKNIWEGEFLDFGS